MAWEMAEGVKTAVSGTPELCIWVAFLVTSTCPCAPWPVSQQSRRLPSGRETWSLMISDTEHCSHAFSWFFLRSAHKTHPLSMSTRPLLGDGRRSGLVSSLEELRATWIHTSLNVVIALLWSWTYSLPWGFVSQVGSQVLLLKEAAF